MRDRATDYLLDALHGFNNNSDLEARLPELFQIEAWRPYLFIARAVPSMKLQYVFEMRREEPHELVAAELEAINWLLLS